MPGPVVFRAAMLSLRFDLMLGDYRVLYLAWLKVLQAEEFLESVLEPPVPPGLKLLSPALRPFVEFFAIDETLVMVAAQASDNQQSLPAGWLSRA
jgi:hypothetical protein